MSDEIEWNVRNVITVFCGVATAFTALAAIGRAWREHEEIRRDIERWEGEGGYVRGR